MKEREEALPHFSLSPPFASSSTSRHLHLQSLAVAILRSPILLRSSRTTSLTMGKKAAAKTTAASKAPMEEGSGHQTGDWARSLVAERDIIELKSQGLLHGMEYQMLGDEETPNPPKDGG